MKILKNKRGFSLLELLLVLGIIAGIVIAAFLIFPKVKEANYVKTEASNISTIRSGVVSLYGGVALPAYNANMSEMLIKAGVVPDNMVGSDKTMLISSWGSPVYVGATTLENGARAFAIRYLNVTNDICGRLAAIAAGSFLEVKVSSSNTSMTGIPNGGTYLKSSSTEFSVNDAITKCTQLGGTGGSGSVGSALTFIF